jgi:hypothetical protein
MNIALDPGRRRSEGSPIHLWLERSISAADLHRHLGSAVISIIISTKDRKRPFVVPLTWAIEAAVSSHSRLRGNRYLEHGSDERPIKKKNGTHYRFPRYASDQ